MLSISLDRTVRTNPVSSLPVGSVFSVNTQGLEGDIFMKLTGPTYTRLYSAVATLPTYTMLGNAIDNYTVAQDFGVLTITNVQEGAQ